MTHNEFRDELKKSEKQAHKRLFESYSNYVYTIVFNRLRSCASREDIEECVAIARESIESGNALKTLKKFIEVNAA